jgi:hypothetical protein
VILQAPNLHKKYGVEMASIKFSLMHFIEQNSKHGELEFDTPTPNTFEMLVENKYQYQHQDTYYEVDVEKRNTYIWFYFEYGNPSPRDDEFSKTTPLSPNKCISCGSLKFFNL